MFGQPSLGQPGAMDLQSGGLFQNPSINNIEVWVGLQAQVRANSTSVLPGSTTTWVAGLQPGLHLGLVHPSQPQPPFGQDPGAATARAECSYMAAGSSTPKFCCGKLIIGR